MGKYCRNCGKELLTGARFCAKCGAGVSGEHANPVPAAQPKPVPQTQTKTEMQPQAYTPPVVTENRNSTAPPKRKGGRKALCIVLSVLLVIQTAAVALYGWPGFMVDSKGGFVETEKAIVSMNNASLTLSGMHIDVNPLNLTDGEKELTVSRKNQSVDETTGLTVVEYDITLGDMHHLNAPLTITVPYDITTAAGGDVVVKHYDREYEMWIPQQTVNNGDGTVSASLISLSPVKLVYLGDGNPSNVFLIDEAGSKYARMKVSDQYWNIIMKLSRDDAKTIVKDFVENGNTKNSMPWAESLLSPEGFGMTSNIYSIFDELVNTVSSFTELTSMQMRFSAEKMSKSISVIGLGIALTQLGIDLNSSNGNDRTAAVNLYKNIFSSSGSLFTYMTGYGSLPFSAAFFGVAVAAFGLDYGVQAAEEYQESVNKAIFDQYYMDHATFDANRWYELFVQTYRVAWQNGMSSEEGVEAAYKTVLDALEQYSETIWADIFNEGDAMTFAVAEAGKTNYYTPKEEQKIEYIEAHKRYMNKRFREKVVPWIEYYLIIQQQNALYAALSKLCEPFNEYYSIEVQEIAPIDSGDPCKYQEHTVRFGSENGFTMIDIPDTWTLHAPQDDDEWAVISEFTYLSYLLAGAPDRVMLYPKGSDAIYPEDAVLTKTFTLTEKATIISLGQTKNDFDYYLVERYDFDPRILYYDGYGYEIMALKRDMQANKLTDHLIRGKDAEVEQEIYREYTYDSSAGLLTMSDGPNYTELKPNADWSVISGYSTSPEYLPGQWGIEDAKTGDTLYRYIRYLSVSLLAPGKWQVNETGETIEYVLHSFDASDQQSKRLESTSGQSFLAEARSFAAEMGLEMYDGQGYD